MLYRYFTEKLLGFCSNVLAKDIEELNAKNIEYHDTRFTKQNNSKELLNAKSGQPKEHLPLVMRLLITSLMKSCYKN